MNLILKWNGDLNHTHNRKKLLVLTVKNLNVLQKQNNKKNSSKYINMIYVIYTNLNQSFFV